MMESTETKRTVSLEEAIAYTSKEKKDVYKTFVNPDLANLLSLIGFDKTFASALGTEVIDSEGNTYLDFLGGYGALNLGHNPKRIYEAISKVQQMPNILQTSINGVTAALAKNLAMICPGELQYSFFSNSGAEAVECALKMARSATGRSKIIYSENSFHGKTMGALSVTGREKYRTLFKPLLADVEAVPYDDADRLAAILKRRDAAAFIIEPIQGEGGIIVPKSGYLRHARDLCSKYETLMIADEVQTGLGRTGKMFACEHENIEPDIMCMAKSLGGGVIPIGATIASEAVWKKAFGTTEKCLLHTSTFGGNTLAAAVGITVIEEIYRLNLIKEAKEKGEYMLSQLRILQTRHPMIKDVRGKGLMIGLEFNDSERILQRISSQYLGSLIAGELLNNHRIITAYTLNNPNVIRMEPPLIVTLEEIDRVLACLEGVLTKYGSFLSLAVGKGKDLLSSVRVW
ncbi:MAG: aspartate aminotransferase family protein [Alkaliphilus sp.]|nr:aspartate aminotransferase family protein [Alkaliphilus sp.]